MIDLVKFPVLTSKATKLLEKSQYTFYVDISLNKPQIKTLIEKLFSYKVLAVNTSIPPRKKRRLGRYKGFKVNYKRVIVTLDSQDVISFFPAS
uniref:Large ribosomal subunit protein uL23c n=1 Tax=Eutreptiella sp. CCMP389 TaxID=96781 RepID=A0A977K896_9EUGL|nr:ribosomal protein L23 [Eutreptiella sp. CCMP389]